MEKRTASILKAAIEEYIKSGLPVSSGQLFHGYNFGIKPAMIRKELNELCERGYLEQVHRSGGRIPTDKAYKFFVEDFLKNKEQKEKKKPFKFISLVDNFIDEPWAEEVLEDCIKCLALELKALSIGYLIEKEKESSGFYAHGLGELVTRLEFQTRREILEVLRDFELMTERLTEKRGWWEDSDEWPQVFFGRSPITRSNNLAVFADKLELGRDRDFLVLTLTPKRTNYDTIFYALRTLENLAKDKYGDK